MNSLTVKTLSFLGMPFVVYFAYYQKAFQGLHLWLIGHEYPLNALTVWYMVMVVIHLAYYTEEESELKICGKNTGIPIEHGFFWLINVLHVTITLIPRFAILFGLRVPSDENARLYGRINHEHQYNQLMNTYQVHINAGPFGALTMKLFEATGLWIFKTPHLVLMRLGFVGMCIFTGASLVHAVVGNPEPMFKTPTISWPEMPKLSQSGTPTVEVSKASPPRSSIQLQAVPYPATPDRDLYQPTSTGSWQCTMVGGWKQCTYPSSTADHVPRLAVQSSLCQVIPFGRELVVFSKLPPVFAEYAEEVSYALIKPPLLGIGAEAPWDVTTSWEELRRNWGKVKVDKEGDKKLSFKSWTQSPDPTARGGRVCFQ